MSSSSLHNGKVGNHLTKKHTSYLVTTFKVVLLDSVGVAGIAAVNKVSYFTAPRENITC